MPKARKSNREAKKESVLSLKEKRAAKKSKHTVKGLLGNASSEHKPMKVTSNKAR